MSLTEPDADDLTGRVEDLKSSQTGELVRKRLEQFKSFRNKSEGEIFSELAFCIMTANFHALRSMQIQKEMGNGFITLPEEELAWELKRLGHRFPNTRAKYIVEARELLPGLKDRIFSSDDEKELREWLVGHVKGLGYKEASHFLRNVGFSDMAIIDFHILDLLNKYGLIDKPKHMSAKKYLEIEQLLKELSNKLNLSLGELDLYLWYLETRQVLK